MTIMKGAATGFGYQGQGLDVVHKQIEEHPFHSDAIEGISQIPLSKFQQFFTGRAKPLPAFLPPSISFLSFPPCRKHSLCLMHCIL